jgi:predicted glycosyltransferase
LQCKTKERILTYEGIKEDVYAPEFKPDSSINAQLNLNDDNIVVTVRPPANEAHYHNPESDALFVEFMKRVCSTPGIKAILLPRNKLQEAQIRQNWPQWFKDSNVIIPKQAVNGLNLLWHSDLVVSGGGTMNREASALGVPVYSIFRGKSGAVDRQLQNEGRLVLIENIDDVENKILLQRRNKGVIPTGLNPGKALGRIVEHIDAIMMKEHSPGT